MKSIIRQINFYIKQALFAIAIIGIYVFTICYSYSNIDSQMWFWLIMVVEVVILVMIAYIYFAIGWDFKKPFCKESTTAKIIETTTLYIKDPVSGVDRYSLVKLEYEYKNKTYKKSLVTGVWGNKKTVKIKVCKWMPKIIYILN